jgi:hypothetical protein
MTPQRLSLTQRLIARLLPKRAEEIGKRSLYRVECRPAVGGRAVRG